VLAKRLRIEGVVQGVGYRHWMVRTATRLRVAGWVRNTVDGAVDAFVEGDADAVEELLRACRRGPPAATVTLIHEDLAEPEHHAAFEARAST
jgi:acylphosphatase